MVDEFHSLENLSEQFLSRVVTNQKRINALRSQQFQSYEEKRQFNFQKSREEYQEFQIKETKQIEILVDEMNIILLEKIKEFEDEKTFKQKEIMQEKIIMQEMEKELANYLSVNPNVDFSKLISPLMPLLVHTHMLLANPELKDKQRTHLNMVKNNILSGMKP
jgi:hypothetical protein